jgi:nicotinic acid mononucleotide adenylyltransferase
MHANWPKNFKLAYGSNEKHKNLLGGIRTSEVRSRIKDGLGISGLVTPSVIEYIKKEKLFL